MNIAILTHYFPPDKPGRIPHDIATELTRRGHSVKVVTTFPHYATGKIHEGFKQTINHIEYLDRIPVRRVPIFPSHSANPIGRVANYLSFVWSARLAKAFIRDADVVYVHGTPATAAAPARVWSKSLGIPFVYHVQDIWPESVTHSGFLPKPLSRLSETLINRWLKEVYSSAAAVNVIAPTARDLLIQRGVPTNKCHLVFNWSARSVEFDLNERRSLPGLTLVYAGNLGRFQDLETVIQAAHRLSDLEDFRLLIAGAGNQETHLKKLVSQLRVTDTVRFLGRLERDQMPELYSKADFQVVSLQDLEFFAGTIPSKFQDGLAHGLPIITTVKGDVTRLVNEQGLGFTALPENIDSLASAFRAAYETSVEDRRQLSRRARDYYEAHLSKAAAIDQIEAILTAAAKTRNNGK